MATNDEIMARFKHHPPKTPERIATHGVIRFNMGKLAVGMNDLLPESREKSLALTALQEAAMWANAAVAIHGEDVFQEKDGGQG